MKPIFAIVFYLLFFMEAAQAVGPLRAQDIRDVRVVVYNTAPKSVKRAFFRMIVLINGEKAANYLVSPGKDDPESGSMRTPRGEYQPIRLEEMHYSSQSDSSIFYQGDPMPFSIFFYKGFALHGSYGVIDGQALSHGCVRLKYDDAKQLFRWVKAAVANGGVEAVTIEIHDT